MEVSGEIHALATLSLAPIEWEAGLAPVPVWTLCRREKSLSPARNQMLFLDHLASKLVITL
jgi:hypothetical protein